MSITIKDKYFVLLRSVRESEIELKGPLAAADRAHTQEESVAEKDNFAISLLCYRYLLQLFMPASVVCDDGRKGAKRIEREKKLF